MEKQKFSILTLILLVILIFVIGGVCGYFYFNYQNSKKITSTPTVSPTISPKITATISATPTAKDETSSWKTYTNKTYNFSIKYPDKYNLVDKTKSDSDVIFHSTTQSNVEGGASAYILEIKISKTNQSLEEISKDWLKDDIFNSSMVDTKVAGQNAKIVKNSDTALGAGKYSACLFIYQGNKYEITATSFEEVAFTKVDFEKILSTFKFSK